MKLKFLQTMHFAHDGCRVREYGAGAVCDVSDPELVKVAIEHGFAVEHKAIIEAPENKSITKRAKK